MMVKTLHASGLCFAYLEEGAGPLVLLLHGFPDTAYSWDSTRSALAAAGFRAVSPFLRGYAPSDIPVDADYRIDTLGHDVAALIEALGEQSAIVVGHDWGAAAAYAAANLHPERVAFLVTIAIAHPAATRPSLSLLWKGRHFLSLRRAAAAERLRRDDFALVDALVRRWSPAWQLAPDENAAVKRAFAEPGRVEAALGYYRAVPLRPPRSLLGAIAAPTLAFAGATDPFFRPRDYERARGHMRGGYEVVTLPGGHFLHREHPDEFHRELVRGLRARPSI